MKWEPRQKGDTPGEDSPGDPVTKFVDCTEGDVGLGHVSCHCVSMVDNGDAFHKYSTYLKYFKISFSENIKNISSNLLLNIVFWWKILGVLINPMSGISSLGLNHNTNCKDTKYATVIMIFSFSHPASFGISTRDYKKL